MTPKISKKNSKKRLWIRGNIWERVKCTDLLTGPRCMVGPKRGMYTLYHSYIFRDCFYFWHSTTISHRKRVPRVTRSMISNSGFVRSADFLLFAHHCRQISEQSHHKHYFHSAHPTGWNWTLCLCLSVITSKMINRVSQKIQKSEFWNATYPSGFHRLDEPPEKNSAL